MTPKPPVPKPGAYCSDTTTEQSSSSDLFAHRGRPLPERPIARRVAALISAAVTCLAFVVVVARTSEGPSPTAGPDGCSSYSPAAPAGSGVVRNVSGQSDLAAALSAANPGDTINLATGRYEQLHYREAYGHRSGLAGRPIVIQAAAGAKPVIGGTDIDPANRKPAVDVVRREHVVIRGLRIGNAMFGARSSGSHHITFEYNNLSNVGHSGIITQALWSDETDVSSHTTIRCNTISQTGQVEAEYGEGIYIGTGTFSATDGTHDIVVEYNELHDLSNEAIDVKHHTTNVSIRHNRIHDVTPNYGGAISLGLNRSNWGPGNYLVEENQIWNVSNGMHYAQAIAVAHGPTEIRNNTIWNVDVDPQSTWPGKHVIQVHGDDNPADWVSAFGSSANNQVTIAGNTIHGCTQRCISSYADAGAITPRVTLDGNVVSAPSAGLLTVAAETVAREGDFVGPTVGEANSGAGPGSGLALRSISGGTTSTSRPSVDDGADTRPPTSSTSASSTIIEDTGGPGGGVPPTSGITADAGDDKATTTLDTDRTSTTSASTSVPTTVPDPIGDSVVTSSQPGVEGGPSTTTPETTIRSGDTKGPSTTSPDDGGVIDRSDDTNPAAESTSNPDSPMAEAAATDTSRRPGLRRGQGRSAERRRGTPPRTTTTVSPRQLSYGHDGWRPAASTRSS